jgi:hypothetical protein
MWCNTFNQKFGFLFFLQQWLYGILYKSDLLFSSLFFVSNLGDALGLFPLELLDQFELTLDLGESLEAVLLLLSQGYLALFFF